MVIAKLKKVFALTLVLVLLFGLGTYVGKHYRPIAGAAPLEQATIFGGNYFNGGVNEVVVDDGIAYVGGEFTNVGKESALSASISASTGTLVYGELGIDTGEGEEVTAVASDGSGGWYIGGYFSLVAGVAINNLAHIESDGSLDETWNPNPDSQIYSIAVSGSDIYVGGSFTTIGGQSRNRIAKLNNTNGNADATWNPNSDSDVLCIEVSGSDVYVGGYFVSIGGQSRNYLAKLNNTNGNADATWNPNSDGYIYDIAVSGSDIYVGGDLSSIGGQSRIGIAKLNNTNGNADATWNPNSDGIVNGIAILSSDIYVGGDFSDIGGQARSNIAKLNNTNGNADATWDPAASGFDDGVYDIAVSGSSVYVAGDFTSIGGQSRFGIAKLNNTNGNADSSWDASPGSYVTDISIYDSDIYVAGYFDTIGGQGRQYLAAIDLSTNELTSWDPAPNGDGVYDIAVSGSDIYVGGSFTTIGGQSRNRIAKLNNTNGNADASWNPNSNSTVKTITISDSYLYVGGNFSTIGGQSRNGLARLASDGTADSAWLPGTIIGLNEYGNPTAQANFNNIVVSGNELYVVGDFNSIESVTRNRIARLSVGDAALDREWNPSADDEVYTIAVTNYGIFAGGIFTTIGGQSRDGLAMLDSVTGVATPSWNPLLGVGGDGDNAVKALAVYESSLLVGGYFSERFARYDDFTSVDFPGNSSSGSSAGGGGGDDEDETPTTPVIPGTVHPLGTNVKNSSGTVFTVTTENGATVLRPYTSWGAFISYGFNSQASIVDANSGDLALSVGSFISPQDGSVICSDRGSDIGTCYFITQGQKAGFTSSPVFTGQGFSFKNTQNGDVSFLVTITPISSASARHLPGALVNNKGTYQIVGNTGLLGFPSASVFSSWGYDFAKAVTANTADTVLTQTGVVSGRIAGQIRLPY